MCPKIRCDGYCRKFFGIKQGLSQVGVYGTVLKNHKRRYRRGEMLTSKLVGDAATERYNDSCNSVLLGLDKKFIFQKDLCLFVRKLLL